MNELDELLTPRALEILKAWQEYQLEGSTEIADRLGLLRSQVDDFTAPFLKYGLIKRADHGYGPKYYRITDRGREELEARLPQSSNNGSP